MTKRTTLFSFLTLMIVAATACQDSSTAPRAANGGKAALACATSSSCSLDTPEPMMVSVVGNVATISWLAVEGATDYVANCGAVTGTASCSGDDAAHTTALTQTFIVGGTGSVTFKVHAHCDAGGKVSDCDLAHIPASGQNSDWGTVTTTVDFPVECQIDCDDDGDLKVDAVATLTGGTFTYDATEHFATGTCNDGDLNIAAYGPAINVGTYNVSATCGGTTTNQVTVNATITITQASMVVNAGSGARTFGQVNPTFSCSVVEAVEAESFTCTATSAANATTPVSGPTVPVNGAIDASTFSLGNYDISYNAGALTILAYDMASCYISPIYSVMPATKSYQKKGSVLPIKCVIRDNLGNTVSNATGALKIEDLGVSPAKDVNGFATAAVGAGFYNNSDAFRLTVGTPNLYMNQQDTSAPAYVLKHYYRVTSTWGDGSVKTGFFYIADR